MTNLKHKEQLMWKLLAPTDPGCELDFDGLDAHPGVKKIVPIRESRPGSALKDSTGRRVVHGYERFHQSIEVGEDLQAAAGITMKVAPSPEDKNYNKGAVDGDRENGMLHGKGVRKYEKSKIWTGTLLPYGSLMDNRAAASTYSVISYRRFLNEPGILSMFEKPIILVHGADSIKNVMHCAQILEMVKFSNGKASALILEFEHLNVQRNVYTQAKYSAMFMHFTYPIIAVTQSEFEFSTKQMFWPHHSLIEEREEDLLVATDRQLGVEKKGWSMPDRPDVPQELSMRAAGTHKLDMMRQFPSDIDYEHAPKAELQWSGVEMYVGDYRHGTKHGKGVFARANGDLMCGRFHRGTAHGSCTYYHRSGNSFIGDWVHGKQMGRGELRTIKMQETAIVLQTVFRCFLARRRLEKLKAAELIRQRALEKVRKLKEAEEMELHKAIAQVKARLLAADNEDDSSQGY